MDARFFCIKVYYGVTMCNRALALFCLPIALLLASCGGGSDSNTLQSCGVKVETPSSAEASFSLEIGYGAALTSTPGNPIAATPRNGGFVDVNTASYALAIWNIDSKGLDDKSIYYDFELYADSGLTDLVAGVSAIPQDENQFSTAWAIGACAPEVTLVSDRQYYWRARAVVDDVPLTWSLVNVFSIVNFCSIGGEPYANDILELNYVRTCDSLAFTDPYEALGPNNASGSGTTADPYQGFVSLDYGGSLIVEMGETVIDGDGPDIRIYEYVSSEPLEVFVSPTEIGPWVSLGVKWCGVYCDFDLALAEMEYARFIQVKDVYSLAGLCHSTSGPDIDAIIGLNVASDLIQCQTI